MTSNTTTKPTGHVELPKNIENTTVVGFHIAIDASKLGIDVQIEHHFG